MHGSIVRDRAARVRAIGRDLTWTFHQSQDGSVRSGLTIEDGSLVVTDNYLKLRIEMGRSRNEWIRVRVKLAGGHLLGEVLPTND